MVSLQWLWNSEFYTSKPFQSILSQNIIYLIWLTLCSNRVVRIQSSSPIIYNVYWYAPSRFDSFQYNIKIIIFNQVVCIRKSRTNDWLFLRHSMTQPSGRCIIHRSKSKKYVYQYESNICLFILFLFFRWIHLENMLKNKEADNH